MRVLATIVAGALACCVGPQAFPALADATDQTQAQPSPSPFASASPLPSPTPNPPVFAVPTQPNSDYPYTGKNGPEPVSTAAAAAVSPQPQVNVSASPTPAPGFADVLADEVYGNSATGGDMTALGHVIIKYQQYDILADEARYNGTTKLIRATGHVQFVSATGDSATASALDYDTVTDEVAMFDVSGQTSSIAAQGQQIQGALYYKAREAVVGNDGTTTLYDGWVTTCAPSHIAYHITGREIDIRPNDRVTAHRSDLYLGRFLVGALGILILPLNQREQHRATVLPRLGYNSYYGFYEKNFINFYRSLNLYGTYHVDFYQKVGVGLGADIFFATRRGNGEFSFYNVANSKAQRALTGARNAFNATLNYQHMFGQHLYGSVNANFLSNSGIFVALPSTASANVSLTHSGVRSNTNYALTANRTGPSIAFNGVINHNIAFSPALSENVSVSIQGSTNPGVYSRALSLLSDTHYTGQLFSADLIDQTNHGAQHATDPITGITTSTPIVSLNKVPELTIRSRQFQLPNLRLPLSFTLINGVYDDEYDKVYTTRVEGDLQLGSAFYRIGDSGNFTATATLREDAYGTGDLQGALVEQYSLQEFIGRHFDDTLAYSAQSARGYTPLQSFDRLTSYENVSDIFDVYNGGVYRFTASTNYDFQRRFLSSINYQLNVLPNPYASVSLGDSYDPHGTGYSPLSISLATPLSRNDYFQFAGFYDFKQHGIQGGTYFIQHTVGDCYQVRLAYRQPLHEVDLSFNLLAFPSETAGFGINPQGPILPTSFEY